MDGVCLCLISLNSNIFVHQRKRLWKNAMEINNKGLLSNIFKIKKSERSCYLHFHIKNKSLINDGFKTISQETPFPKDTHALSFASLGKSNSFPIAWLHLICEKSNTESTWKTTSIENLSLPPEEGKLAFAWWLVFENRARVLHVPSPPPPPLKGRGRQEIEKNWSSFWKDVC